MCLVGGFNPEKYESQWEDYPMYYGKLKMFQTTNQCFQSSNMSLD
jgi:hypothetical protein